MKPQYNRENFKVKCNWCDWVGVEDDLIINDDMEHCPNCNRPDCLMDVEDREMVSTMIDIKDYFSMRKNKLASNVKWLSVRSLNLPNGNTLWQEFAKLDDYIPDYEPTLTQIVEIEKILNI